ncbi:MAG: hypothetical protein ABIK84_04920 [candidate division WOR-3 bacterium]
MSGIGGYFRYGIIWDLIKGLMERIEDGLIKEIIGSLMKSLNDRLIKGIILNRIRGLIGSENGSLIEI